MSSKRKRSEDDVAEERSIKRVISSVSGDSSKGATPSAYIKDKDWWFCEGTVVFVATKTAFRVHRDVLSRKCRFFRDMFENAVVNEADETVEGCPVVHVQDEATDFSTLMRAIYDGATFDTTAPPAHKTNQQTLKDAASILSLADKYCIPDLRRRAVASLSIYFPAILSEFDELPRDIIDFDTLTSIITTTRRVGAFHLLPSAYYIFCRTYFISSLNNISRSRYSGKALSEVFPVEELCAFLHFRDGLIASTRRFLSDFSDLPIALTARFRDCQNANTDATCANILRKSANRLAATAFKSPTSSNAFPLECASMLEDMSKRGRCKACFAPVLALMDKYRGEMWAELPHLLNLHPWHKLLEEAEVLEEVTEESQTDSER